MTHVLGIFAKKPVAGMVKTRLADATSAAWAAEVAECLLAMTLDACAELADRRILAFSPENAFDYFRKVSRGRYEVQPQGEGDLGQRMARFFNLSQDSDNRVVLIGSDSPTLPTAYIRQAFALLNKHNVVLSPATDGGYVLIGCRAPIPPIFTGISWGGSRVLQETLEALPSQFDLALLPPWYDVDTLEDYQMLRGHLQAMARAGLMPWSNNFPAPPCPSNPRESY